MYENAKEDIHDEEDNVPLNWRMMKPVGPTTPAPALKKDQVGKTKGKAKVSGKTKE